MIEGVFREGIERHAELPDVEPATFEHFLAYAYSASIYRSGDQIITQTPSTPRTSTSRLVEVLLVKGHKVFRCKSCYETRELKFSSTFPQCDECNQDELQSLKWESHCIVSSCSAIGKYVQGLFCAKCLGNLDIVTRGKKDGAKQLQLNLPGFLEELQDFHFDIPLRASDILRATKDSISLPLPEIINLLDTVRLAVFADIYEVKPLSQAALVALYWKLTQEVLNEENIISICELTDYVYNNTPNRSIQTSIEDAHILRRILSQFIATYRDKFTSSQTFMQLLSQGGELAGDILLALSFAK